MKKYKVREFSELYIEGESIKDAVEKDFDKIADKRKLGNAAGYTLHYVWGEYSEEVAGVVLHIGATGSDTLIGYSPDDDPVKEYTVTIIAEKADCPERFDVELVSDSTKDNFNNPFNDEWLERPYLCYGGALALIDCIAEYHSQWPEAYLTGIILQRFPTISRTPLKYIEVGRKELCRCRPKSDKETMRLMERISDFTTVVAENPKADYDSWPLGFYKARGYFRTLNKTTAIAAIRKSKGMTQKQLAEAAQVSVRQLQNYEKCFSTLENAAKYMPKRIADALGVDAKDIMDEYGSVILVDKK